MQLIATKEVKYANVVRKPGDRFEASSEDARLLKGFGKARDASGAAQDQEPSEDIDALRSRFRQMRGQEPDMRWGVGRLQRETAAACTYNRRDMRAED